MWKFGYFAVMLAFFVCLESREDFQLFLGLYTLLFLIYLALANRPSEGVNHILLSTLIFAAPAFCRDPVLSNDVYRFIWDGQLLVEGQSPFAYVPSAIKAHNPTLFQKLNSPDYFSVYPPMSQFCFWLGAKFGGQSEQLQILFFRLILLFSVLGSAAFLNSILKEMKIITDGERLKRVSLLAYNPLLLIEAVGNVHFEALVLCLLLGAFWVYIRYRHWVFSAILFGLSVSVKLMPLVLIPLIIQKLGFKKGFGYALLVFGVNLLLFLPFADARLFENIQSSLGLYFQTFEFNASLFYLFRALGFAVAGFNIISYLGPALGLLGLLSICAISFSFKNQWLLVVLILLIHLLCSTTVHPWYILPLFGVSLLTPYRFPLWWTALIALSYAAYRQLPPNEDLILVAVEYLILAISIALSIGRTEERAEIKN